MPFECPECKSQTVEILAALELPADASSDEITLQVIACTRCGFQGMAVYTESRRGSLDGDSWRHDGWRASEVDCAELAQAIRECPQPDNPRCVCADHQRYGKTGLHGEWDGLNGVRTAGSFAMLRKA
jgi:hypothetical protein